MKKKISMIMADWSWGHKIIFRRDTRGLCSQGTQRTNKSSFVFVCVTTRSVLFLNLSTRVDSSNIVALLVFENCRLQRILQKFVIGNMSKQDKTPRRARSKRLV